MLTELEVLALSASELEDAIRKHNALYWERNAPEIPDALYDLMVERLRELAPASPVLRALASDPVDENARVEHAHPMLSLDKCYTGAELNRWYDRFVGDAIVSPKIDGVAMALRYDEDGQLTLGATRGDGRQGERITENAKRVEGVPEKIERGPLEVRGEAYIPLSVFQDRWADQFANPRNLAAGALKQKDPDVTRTYGVHFLAYGVMGLEYLPTVAERFDRLVELGFHPVPYLLSDKEHGQETFEKFSEKRRELDYEIDGVVYMVNDAAQHEEMGHTAHHPRFAMAYKFQGESGTSVLRAVEWSVSRTGKINPIAIVDPVSLSGVTVKRVSLHNLGIMEQLGDGSMPTLNASALITRRGGVIPHMEAIVSPGDTPVHVPTTCPSCGVPTRREDDFLVADHTTDCVTSALKRLEHFSSVTDIRGLGPKVLAQLFEAQLVREPGDIYLLTKEEICTLDRTGEKSALNLLNAIADRRTLRVSTFIAALGIRELGMQAALALEKEFHENWDELLTADVARLTAIDGIGDVIAQNIEEGFAQLKEVIDRLLLHITLVWPIEAAGQELRHPLAGRAVVFTGAMEHLKRKDAQDRVREVGGSTPSAVSAAVHYLVIGDGDMADFEAGRLSSKAKKAVELQEKGHDIQIISESDFMKLVEER